MRAKPRRFLSCFNHLQLPAPHVETHRPYPEFSRQLTDIFTSLHACDSHSLKFPGIPFPLHLWFLSRKLCPFLCVSSRVHSIFLWPEPLREPFRRWLPFRKALESSRKNRNFFRKRSYERNEVLGEGCARKNPSLIGIPEASARRMRQTPLMGKD